MATRFPASVAVTAVALIGLFVVGCMHRAQAAEAVDTAIVFVQDTSSSMTAAEIATARQSYMDALTNFNVLYGITHAPRGRVAAVYVEFNHASRVVVPWTVIDGPEAAQAFADAIDGAAAHIGQGSTSIARAMELADSLLAALPYEADRMVVDIVGDGVGDGGQIFQRASLIARGATINGLPMLIQPDAFDLAAYYTNEVIGGPGAFTMVVTDVSELPVALFRKISLELW